MSILGALGTVLGGLLGKGKDPYTPSQNINSLAKGAIQASEKFGFNALTLLGAGAGQGGFPGSQPRLAGAQFLGELGDAVADSWSSRVPANDAMAQAIRARELNRMQDGTLANKVVPRNFGYNLQANTVSGPVTLSGSPLTTRPQFGPYLQEKGRTWVHDPAGGWINTPSDVAERFGVKPGGNLTGGDWSEMLGEFVGEAEALAYAIPVRSHMVGGGLGGDPLERPKPKASNIPPRPKSGARAQWLWDQKYKKSN